VREQQDLLVAALSGSVRYLAVAVIRRPDSPLRRAAAHCRFSGSFKRKAVRGEALGPGFPGPYDRTPAQ
jgi:hypothetical protein